MTTATKTAKTKTAGQAFQNVTIHDLGRFTYRCKEGWNHSACFPLALISMAWHAGCNFEDLADGFGRGLGTMGGDWSGIRDSSDEATAKMLERALNFIQSRL
jgi:aryl-alcohol dehydrogenase-like predicted oxidoreductase